MAETLLPKMRDVSKMFSATHGTAIVIWVVNSGVVIAVDGKATGLGNLHGAALAPQQKSILLRGCVVVATGGIGSAIKRDPAGNVIYSYDFLTWITEIDASIPCAEFTVENLANKIRVAAEVKFDCPGLVGPGNLAYGLFFGIAGFEAEAPAVFQVKVEAVAGGISAIVEPVPPGHPEVPAVVLYGFNAFRSTPPGPLILPEALRRASHLFDGNFDLNNSAQIAGLFIHIESTANPLVGHPINLTLLTAHYIVCRPWVIDANTLAV